MKKLIISAIAIIVVASTFTACKKGSGDPGISLKSRKGRVTGEWKATKIEVKSNSNNTYSSGGNSDNLSSSSTMKAENGTATYSSTENDNGDITTVNLTGTVEYTVTFEKDGSYKAKFTRNLNGTTVNSGNSINTKVNSTEETTGGWNFIGGQEKDYKNKERILLNILTIKGSTTTDYDIPGTGVYSSKSETDETTASGENTETWVLTSLKNKSIEATGSGKSTYKYTDSYSYMGNNGSGTGNNTSDFTFTITLEQ
ncbi:MAG: hypothetical protein HJHJAOHD_01640 [Flavobacteriales bacterium]|nr:hypothetical protein [Flavobacteriales bacterium]MCL4815678.1 hypothetical protein [Flavobacteriales bacterium]WKZ76495.1 MAG: hypothetical protein QY303_06250 [Vicingaceae bacterium]